MSKGSGRLTGRAGVAVEEIDESAIAEALKSRMLQPWSRREEEVLKELYPKVSKKTLVKVFKRRTLCAIYDKAKMMGLQGVSTK